jgi:hypothetical protein
MRRRRVQDSSLLVSVGWQNAILEVRYSDDKVFRYKSVPESVYLRLLEPDAGQWWLEHRDAYEFTEGKK